MKILITGICGFVGSSVARGLLERLPDAAIWGIDNLSRRGSERNRGALEACGVQVRHGDTRLASDFEQLPAVDWVIDAAANPSILAGVDGKASSRQLVEHNLSGTVQTLEYCKTRAGGFVLLSSSRVYSIRDLLAIPLKEAGETFQLDDSKTAPAGVSRCGLTEAFSTEAPVSLYGATKLASEVLALEYGDTFGFPVWVNRCGVLAGAGQFGTAEQGIFSYWIHAHRARRPLRFSGFGCRGLQVRDALHPEDLTGLLTLQMRAPVEVSQRVFHAGGGAENSMSLAQLAQWCGQRFGPHPVSVDSAPRRFDAPWLVMDSRRAHDTFGWHPAKALPQILDEIAAHAEQNPQWLDVAGG